MLERVEKPERGGVVDAEFVRDLAGSSRLFGDQLQDVEAAIEGLAHCLRAFSVLCRSGVGPRSCGETVLGRPQWRRPVSQEAEP